MSVESFCSEASRGWTESTIRNKRKTEIINSIGLIEDKIIACTDDGTFWITSDLSNWSKYPPIRQAVTKLGAAGDKFENKGDYLFFEESRGMYAYEENKWHQIDIPFYGGEKYSILDNGNYTLFFTENIDKKVKSPAPFELDKGLFYICQNIDDKEIEKFSFSYLPSFDGVYLRRIISASSKFFALMYHLERNMFMLFSAKDGEHWDYHGNILKLEDTSRESYYSVNIYSILDMPLIKRLGKIYLYNIDKDEFESVRIIVDDRHADLNKFYRIIGSEMYIYGDQSEGYYLTEDFKDWSSIELPLSNIIKFIKQGNNLICFGFIKNERKLFYITVSDEDSVWSGWDDGGLFDSIDNDGEDRNSSNKIPTQTSEIASRLKQVEEIEARIVTRLINDIKSHNVQEVMDFCKDEINRLFINKRGERELTPLIWSIIKSDEDIVKILLENGADPNIPDQDDNSALTISLLYQNPMILFLLLNFGAKPSYSEPQGLLPLLGKVKNAIGDDMSQEAYIALRDIIIKYGMNR